MDERRSVKRTSRARQEPGQSIKSSSTRLRLIRPPLPRTVHASSLDRPISYHTSQHPAPCVQKGAALQLRTTSHRTHRAIARLSVASRTISDGPGASPPRSLFLSLSPVGEADSARPRACRDTHPSRALVSCARAAVRVPIRCFYALSLCLMVQRGGGKHEFLL